MLPAAWPSRRRYRGISHRLGLRRASDDTRSINAGLGESLVADGKIADAIDAFQSATADGLYELTPSQQAAFDSARETVSSQSAIASTQAGEVAFDTGADPLDPLGKSGNFMPDPSDTGFFTLSESEMIPAGQEGYEGSSQASPYRS